MDIAVIGSGIAGLVTAHLCQKSGINVTIFEKEEKRGIDAHRLDLDPGPGFIDVPLRVMSPEGWKTVLAVAKSLDVPTFAVGIGLSFSWNDGETWLSIPQVMWHDWVLPIPSSFRYITKQNLSYLMSFRKLAKILKSINMSTWQDSYTLTDFFNDYRINRHFTDRVLIPVLQTVTTCERRFISNYPAKFILESLANIMAREQMVRFAQGTQDLASKLASGLKLISGSPVVDVSKVGDRFVIRNARGDTATADHVVTAVQANHLNVLNQVIEHQELNMLNSLSFDRGEIICHQDTRLMPKDRRDWCVLNYRMNKELSEDSFTVWVNPIEPSLKSTEDPIFQTWNPTPNLQIDRVLSRTILERSVVTKASAPAWLALNNMASDGNRRVHYCGSWSYPGVPLLESAVRSAVRVAKLVGAKIPWENPAYGL